MARNWLRESLTHAIARRLRKACHKIRLEMIEEQCTQSDLGISYKKFIKKCLGPHTNQVIAEELKKTIGHPFDMLILLAGVDAGNSPHLYVISDTAITSYITLGYAAVGCGTTIATTSLADDGKGYYRRSIAETSYRVYEAKRAAHKPVLSEPRPTWS